MPDMSHKQIVSPEVELGSAPLVTMVLISFKKFKK